MEKIQRFQCPHCGHWCDAAAAAEDNPTRRVVLKEGDFLVCFYCTSVLRVTQSEPLELKLLTSAEVSELSNPDTRDRLIGHQNALRHFHVFRKAGEN